MNVWTVINSPIVMTIVTVVVGILLNKLYQWRPAWKKYEPLIIEAIRYVEKSSSGEVDSKSKLNMAVNYVLKILNERKKGQADNTVVDIIEDGIRLKHSEVMESVNKERTTTS